MEPDNRPTVMDDVIYTLARSLASVVCIMTTIRHRKWDFGMYVVSIDMCEPTGKKHTNESPIDTPCRET
jgi:hypothetical protein